MEDYAIKFEHVSKIYKLKRKAPHEYSRFLANE